MNQPPPPQPGLTSAKRGDLELLMNAQYKPKKKVIVYDKASLHLTNSLFCVIFHICNPAGFESP